MLDLGGCRLPWKSLKAISFTSTGSADRGAVVAQPPERQQERRRRQSHPHHPILRQRPRVRGTLWRESPMALWMSDMSELPDPLVERARAAALGAYAPYSRFSVGCAIVSADGEIAVGANMENACYRLGVCAEIAALTAAQQAFGLAKVARIAVAGGHVADGDWRARRWSPPAAAAASRSSRRRSCRGADVEMISANGDGTEVRVNRISELIPWGFGPDNLKDAG